MSKEAAERINRVVESFYAGSAKEIGEKLCPCPEKRRMAEVLDRAISQVSELIETTASVNSTLIRMKGEL